MPGSGGTPSEPAGSSVHAREQTVASSILVGRAAELAELRARLDEAAFGRGALAILSGEAGIGKTHLADRFAFEAQDAGFATHWGRGWEGGGAPAYWPWVQVLRSVRGGEDASKAWLDDRSARYLSLLLPEVEAEVDAPPVERSEQARFHLFDAVTRYLRAVADDRPLLLVLDDIQLFDTPSLQLLEFLARELRTMRSLAIASHREPDPNPDPLRAEVLGRIGREATTLYVRGLERDEVRALIESHASEPPSDDAVARLHDLTGGNPLFVAELVRLLSVTGRLDERELSRRSVAIPGGVRRAIRARLDQLDEDLIPVFRVAAVLGPSFDARLLAEVIGSSESSVQNALEAAADTRLLTASDNGRRWSFSHELVREVLYEDTPRDERVRLHRAAGEALERSGQVSGEELVDSLAHHFFESAEADDVDRALGYVARAAQRSMQVFAYREAAAGYDRALALLDRGARAEPAKRAELLLGLGSALSRAGEATRARDVFRSAADGARALGDAENFAEAALGFGRETMTSGAVDSELVALLEEALVLGEVDDHLRLALLKRLCDELLYSDESARRAELSHEAVDVARRIGEPAALALALGAQALAGDGPDTVPARLSAGLEMVKIGRDERADEIVLDGHILRIGALLESGDISTADEEIARYASLGERFRQPNHRWFALVVRGGRAILAGRFDEAEALIERARELGEELRGEEAREYQVAQRFVLLWERSRDRLGEVEGDVRRLAEEYPSLPAFRAMLLAIQSSRGRRGIVEGGLRELHERGLARLPKNLGWLAAIALLSESVAAVEDEAAAEQLYDLLAPYEEHNVVFDWSIASFGWAGRYLGLLAATLGRTDESVDHLEKAIEHNLRMGALPQAARAQLDLATALGVRDRPGDRDRGRELASEARASFSDLGMEREAALADRTLIELGGVPLSTPAADQAIPSVFRKEGDYWAVAYESETFRLKDAKGLAYLARLLAEPGREFHALDLFAAPGGNAGPGERDEAVHVDAGQGAGPRLDPEAKAAYRRRLADLDEDVEEAEAYNDPARAAKAREERDFLIRELAGAVGLGGRDRPTGSAAERARVNVTKAIRTAVSKIEEHGAELGHHLRRTVRTGTFCSYQPDPRTTIAWKT